MVRGSIEEKSNQAYHIVCNLFAIMSILCEILSSGKSAVVIGSTGSCSVSNRLTNINRYLMGENEKKRNPQYRSISERSMKLDGYDSAIISCCVRIKPNLDFCVYDRFKDNNNQQGTVSSKEIIVSDGLSNIHEQVTACTSYVEHCGFQGTNVSGNSLQHDITAEVSAYVGYPRLLEKDEIRLGRLLKVQYRFLIMGSNTLKELKDAIKCPGDYQVFDDVSERRVNVDDLPKNRYPSSYFFIHDTFYIDLESKGAQDITEGIRTWARERGRGEMKVADMNTTRVVDLTCRLGAPYLYLHVGTCEHLICFNDLYLRIGHGLAGPHPIMFYESNQRRLACVGCRDNTAEWIVWNHECMPVPVQYLCDSCYKDINFDVFGKKVFKFEAAPYYDRHTKKSDPDLREHSDGNDGTELNERTTV